MLCGMTYTLFHTCYFDFTANELGVIYGVMQIVRCIVFDWTFVVKHNKQFSLTFFCQDILFSVKLNLIVFTLHVMELTSIALSLLKEHMEISDFALYGRKLLLDDGQDTVLCLVIPSIF